VKNHDFTPKNHIFSDCGRRRENFWGISCEKSQKTGIFFPIADGGAKIFGVFRVKNHDFTPKNHIFSNCGRRRENFWDIQSEKSRFYAKKSIFFSNFRGARAGCAPPPCTRPCI
jgi:hypothetical protein